MSALHDALQRLTTPSVRQSASRSSIIDAVGQVLTGILGLMAIATLVAEHGFYLTQEQRAIAEASHIVILYGFVVLIVVRMVLSSSAAEFARSHRADLVLVGFVLFLLLAPGTVTDLLYTLNPLLTASDVSALYIALTQGFLLSAFLPSVLRASRRLTRRNIHPAVLLAGSFAGLVAVGTALLLMPRASVGGLSTVDALFMSASAVCVTGLTVVDTSSHFTPLGHGILLGLIQIGGLGIMTLTTFLGWLLGGGGGLREYATLQSLLGEENIGRIRRTLWTVALATLAFEAAGAAALYSMIDPAVAGSGSHRTFFAAFHAVSAFCNAGFSLVPEGLAHPALRMNHPLLLVIMVLVVTGGIGFPVLANIGSIIGSWVRRRAFRRRLTLQSKIVIGMSLLMIALGTVGLRLLADGSAWTGMSSSDRWWTSAFHSVIARTAGFNTVDISALPMTALFLLIVLMWVGGSPGSTAGGVKTTAVALALLNIRAIVTGAERVEAFRTTISGPSIVRAFSTIVLSFFLIGGLVFLLLLTDAVTFHAAVFEVVSAVGTVGLTTGITPTLSDGGKLVIIAGMFIGRIGVLSFAIAITGRWQRRRAEYPSENVQVT